MKDKIDNILKKIADFTDNLAAVFLFFTFLVVLMNVILRYVFNSGWAWSEEAARYLFSAMVLFGFISITRTRDHYKVDAFTNKLPAMFKRVVYVVQDLIIIALLYILCDGAVRNIILRWDNRSAALHIPEWILYGVMLFSCSMMLLFMVVSMIKDITGVSKEVQPTVKEEKGEEKAC